MKLAYIDNTVDYFAVIQRILSQTEFIKLTSGEFYTFALAEFRV